MKLNRIYTWLRHPGESLSQRVVHAGFWVFVLRVVGRLFGLARTIVLARLLSPNDFGLYGIALLTLSALETFSQTGFDQALIQKKEDTKPYLDTAWTVQVIRGFVLASILVLGAPLVGSFFGEPRAVLLVRVLGFAVLLKSLGNIAIVYFRKELEFHKQFVYEFSGTFADLAVAIPAAFILRSVWALVFGLLAGNLVRMVVSYFIHPYKPRVRFKGAKAKELYTFGRWMLGSGIMGFLAIHGPGIFLGKVLGVTALGFYQMAFRISYIVKTDIGGAFSTITFPAFSKLQNNIPKLREGFLTSLAGITFLSMPISAGILLLSSDFTRIFLGEKWMPMVPALQIMVITSLIWAIREIIKELFKAMGCPRLVFWMHLAQVGAMAIVIFPLTISFGLSGTAIAVLLTILATIPIWWYKSAKIIGATSHALMKEIVSPLAGVFVMGVFITIVRQLVEGLGGLGFFFLVLTGVISYSSLMLVLWKRFHYGALTYLRILKR